MRSFLTFGVFLLLVAGAAFFGARFTPGEWYQSLERPPLTPPSWVFGPVWSLLYLAIAVAAFLVWRAREPATERRAEPPGARLQRPPVGPALGLWGVQLGLNALWSWLFFGLERPGLALIDIALLLLAVVATTVMFGRIRTAAGLLFVPYAVWVAFATYLNAGFWWLNRGGGAGGGPIG